jgi:glutamine synthetase
LAEALEELRKDEVIKQILGAHILDRFVEAKEKEYDNFRITVHQWEIDNYLETY